MAPLVGNICRHFYIVERNFAEQIQPSPEISAAIKQVNGEVGINWLSHFSVPTNEKLIACTRPKIQRRFAEAAQRLNIPTDAIIEVGEVPADSPVPKWSLLR
jgi:hypothetical protein